MKKYEINADEPEPYAVGSWMTLASIVGFVVFYYAILHHVLLG